MEDSVRDAFAVFSSHWINPDEVLSTGLLDSYYDSDKIC